MAGPLHCARRGRALDGDRNSIVMDESDGVLDGQIDTERHDDAGSGSFDE